MRKCSLAFFAMVRKTTHKEAETKVSGYHHHEAMKVVECIQLIDALRIIPRKALRSRQPNRLIVLVRECHCAEIDTEVSPSRILSICRPRYGSLLPVSKEWERPESDQLSTISCKRCRRKGVSIVPYSVRSLQLEVCVLRARNSMLEMNRTTHHVESRSIEGKERVERWG